jgi:hypothetical protein
MLRTREGGELLLSRRLQQVVEGEAVDGDELVDIEQVRLALALLHAADGALAHTELPADLRLREPKGLSRARQAQPEHAVAITVLWSRHRRTP